MLFAVADALEALSCVLLYGKSFSGGAFRAGLRGYRGLLAEAGPQLGTVLFAALLARFDWLLLAARCPAAVVAEYSFAYKAFELAQLPLLVIAPLLVPRFTRLLQSGSGLTELRGLLRTELGLALLTVLLLNACWTPLADWVSGGKYGASCRSAVWLLSLALPVLYYNNYLWSLHFAAGRTGFIFRIFAVTFAVNAGANLLLIPSLQKEGAAIAFGLSLLVQTVFYHVYAQPEWRGRLLRRREATRTA
ncbi:MAG: hypothetical protein EOP50_13910 [Sphingobacteriales bacterium]|nr:MAG: hypothetical protein EOP50_13910 [Sphingobacteriales bacterium]